LRRAPSGVTYSSQQNAADVLRRAVDAHGGTEAINGIRGISYSWEGSNFPRTQGRVAQEFMVPEPESLPIGSRHVLDLARSRFHSAFDGVSPGGITSRFIVIANGREFLSYDERSFFGGTGMNLDSTGASADQRRARAYEDLPVLMLRLALAASPSLRYLGEEEAGGRRYDVVAFANPQGRQIAVRIDSHTGLITGWETLAEDPIFGDVATVVQWSDYESISGLMFPRVARTTQNGLLLSTFRLGSLELDPAVPDSLFRHPAGYSVTPRPAPPAVTKFADGVFFAERLGGGYRTMFVDTDEGVLVVDAPLSPAVTAGVIRMIQETLPGRPIRYVMLTHHHADHVGGLSSYVALGATVLAGPGTEEYLRTMLRAPRTLNRADAVQVELPAALIETVTDALAIGTADGVIQILNPGPTSHAAGMLLAYLPHHRLLFQGDFLRINQPGGPAPGTGIARELEQIIERLRLDVHYIGAVHGLNGTIHDLRAAAVRQD
jgi:glyoxylase-like metal-dependent hydrolase (beta-lactamase superfamily II)